MLFVFTMIEDVVRFLYAGGLRMDYDSVVDFFRGETKAILIENFEGAGVLKDDDKWVLYLPINVIDYDNNEGGMEELIMWDTEEDKEHDKINGKRKLKSIRKLYLGK